MPALIPALLSGLFVGILIGFTGIGGGVVLFPILTIGFGLDPVAGVASAFLFSFLSRFGAIATHYRMDNINLGLGGWMSAGGLPVVVFMSFILQNFKDEATFQDGIRFAFIVIVAITFIAMLKKPKLAEEDADADYSKPKAMGAGALLGAIVGMTSVGGGVVAIPMMIYWFETSTLRAVGTSVLVTMIMALSGVLVHMKSVELTLVMTMVAASLPAAMLGAWLTKKVSEIVLDRVVASLMLVAAISQVVDFAIR
jgi:hypothetical protein